ncbi:MAG: arginine--tRNA ligase [Gammaproteobacteria bacterium]|nr:arginine--tRNA ligase [Gammaproteobacteria bacterium]
MKVEIKHLVNAALEQLKADGELANDVTAEIVIERARDKSHGDFACNIAMRLAKPAKRKPRDIAELIIAKMPVSEMVKSVDIAGPGFINFTLADTAFFSVIKNINQKAEVFGNSSVGENKKVQVEFVSANPTGPLHVGHGRGAAYGAVVANLLKAVGYQVSKEYYVNDAGRQMDILGTSVWLRYLEHCGEKIVFPSNGYKGDYIMDIAAMIFKDHGEDFRKPFSDVIENIPADEEQDGGDKEAHVDGLISKAKSLLGHANYRTVFGVGLNSILTDIREDLAEFGVTFDEWFSERSLLENGAIEKALNKLKENNYVYEKDGALWFKSTDFGDEKDRVVVRDNGQHTYFAADIAYHLNKFDRGFDKCLDIWGADHHGYVSRVKGSIKAMGQNPDALDVLLVQFAVLYKGGQKMQMSTRSGQFVTLRELREDVGNDAARFFYVMRKCEQHLDFDLDLAKSQSNENPVYYIQYAHARICSVFRELNEKGFSYDESSAESNIHLLNSTYETALMSTLARFPEVVENAALNYEPHNIPHYLRELSNEFHTYYNAQKFIVDDEATRNARLYLIKAIRQVIHNGLALIGVSAPEAM